jgi:hypothetical protein
LWRTAQHVRVFQGHAHRQVPPALLRLLRLDAWGETGGHQGDPLEMIIFCLTVQHLWVRTLNQHQQDACAVAFADDGCNKANLSIASRCSRTSNMYSRRTLASPSISTRPRFSSRVSRRLMRTLPHSACSMPIPPSRTSVPYAPPSAALSLHRQQQKKKSYNRDNPPGRARSGRAG